MAKKVLTYTGLVEVVAKLKAFVSGQISAIDTTLFKVVTELPTDDIDSTKIYVVPASTTADSNVYIEYAYLNGEWEKLGEAVGTVDLSSYVNAAEGSGTNCTVTATIVDSKLTVDVNVPEATTESAGALSADDKSKLDSLEEIEEITNEEIDALFEE